MQVNTLGLGISYDRLFQVSTDIGNSLCMLYEREKVVCPPALWKGIFTAGMVDNIDHNPSSRTAKDSFHGTGVSIVQFPTSDNPGMDRNIKIIDPDIPKMKDIMQLPDSYTEIVPFALYDDGVKVPLVNRPVVPGADSMVASREKEEQWLKKVEDLYKKNELSNNDNMSWAAYHASQQADYDREVSRLALLPLFKEEAHSVAMIKHAMDVVRNCTSHLNPGQTPVITMDQPLYTLCKKIQWDLGGGYGEDRYVCMLGPLHIEMAALRVLGEWLTNSGWLSMLVKADIATSGRAEGIEKASHVTRTRYAHEVCLLTFILNLLNTLPTNTFPHSNKQFLSIHHHIF